MTVRGYRASFGSDENVLNLKVMMVAKLCQYIKNHQSVNCKLVNCSICEFYLTKSFYKKKKEFRFSVDLFDTTETDILVSEKFKLEPCLCH